jgi:endo-1,4-beta-mannosidase
MPHVSLPRFGANYVPSRRWWFSWVDWDADAIAQDLQALAALGLDHIRIHCLWPVFQPNATYVSEAALARLAELMDLADQAGLDVVVTVLDGWLSGFFFDPPWRGGRVKRNLFTDPEMIAAEKRLFLSIAARIGGHPRFLGFDLGNEMNVLCHFGVPISPEEGDAWCREMLAWCQQVAPDKFHVNGVDHLPWFRDFAFSRAMLATTGSATSVHCWYKFTGAMQLYGPLEVGAVHLAEYCVELAHAYAADLARPVWLQEFGASTQWMPEGAVSAFAEATIRNVLGCRNLWGCTWWCSHDLNPAFSEFDPLEYDLGLLDHRNQIKPVGERVRGLIQALRAEPPLPITRPVALVLPDDLLAQKRGAPLGWDFARPYMDLVAQGLRPAIVLASRAQERAYLEARGIEELRQP